ncbi:bifunctional enoyl-CoA hydratase/phosphate acetyltransferase [Xanthobacter sp. KR7-225]|uniref:bifunctional enoyl-CoA hydratase/phosphate acetyltransferase n=1 Tax=Xanthobacter sp. KR7-225 TaxID=3156613 RepID=UPI0032B42088
MDNDPAAPKSQRLDGLIGQGRAVKALPMGVVYPLNGDALAGALEPARDGLIEPVLVGPEAPIRDLARKLEIDLGATRIVDVPDAEAAAATAAAMAGRGEVLALMKGSLHTDTLLHAVVQKEAGLRTGRLLSHCALIFSPAYGRRIILSDAAINIAPDLDAKRDICQNAIFLAHAVGIAVPKVAIVSAVETVRSKMPSTLDGAALAKMADRRQIVGGIVDGPLDLDGAVDPAAARIKKIVSPVAGMADVLIAANIDAANAMYKEFLFMAGAQAACCVMGAKVPIVLTSRADSAETRTLSAALAVIVADAVRRKPDLFEGPSGE